MQRLNAAAPPCPACGAGLGTVEDEVELVVASEAERRDLARRAWRALDCASCGYLELVEVLGRAPGAPAVRVVVEARAAPLAAALDAGEATA